MSLHDEGFIKFECEWIDGPAPDDPALVRLRAARDRLHVLGLIGVTPDGIGFGNASIRSGDGFIVTGTQTGAAATLTADATTRVVAHSLERNWLSCIGPVRASSESLTHAALYDCSDAIRAVVHVHSAGAWERLLHTIPTTAADVPYGTPAMARELQRLYRETALPSVRVAAMAGHPEGLIAFGQTIEEATRRVVEWCGPAQSSPANGGER